MLNKLDTWLATFGVSGWLVFLIRHYGQQVKDFIVGPGTDEVVMEFLKAVKAFLIKYGATPDEIHQVELAFAQVALRASQDITKDTTPSK